MLNVNDREWAPFHVIHLFDTIRRGKRLRRADQTEGDTPYVSSSASNNGVDGFISREDGCRVFSDCISLANSGSVGAAFYEPFEFVASDHVTHLKREGLSRGCYLFIATCLGRQKANFNFNREINDRRISGMRLMLPVDASGEPDWEFMEDYVREREALLLGRVREFLNGRIARIEREREKRE